MDAVFQYLHDQPFLTIFGVVAAGMAVGKRAVAGVSPGSVVGILLVGLALSVWAFNTTGVSLALPDILKTVFFNLFIFSMGVKIGPQFFAGLRRDGWHLVAIGAVVAVLAPAVTLLCGWIFTLPQGALAGLLAGSNNSSASFGTAASAVQSGLVQVRDGGSAELVAGALSAAFALCYAVSEVQFVLFMKWLPGLARIDAPRAAREFTSAISAQQSAPKPGTAEAADLADTTITVRAYRASADVVAGRTIREIRDKAPRVAVELVRRSGGWLTPTDSTTLEADDEVVVSAPLAAQVRVREVLGPELPDAEARSLVVLHTVDIVVGRTEAAGQSLPALTARLGAGLYPNAVFRAGEELPGGPETILAVGDVVRVTGSDRRIGELGQRIGQVVRATHSSDVLTLSLGLLAGAALGTIPVPLFGVSISFGAAAVLVTGILFGWVKTRHPALGGPISEGARRLMEELGLNVFTAVLAVSALPALVAWWVGRHVLGMNPALLMGAIAGARQNTASLHAAEAETHSAVPGIGYPVPLAISTVSLSVAAYFIALFA
jgi:putative transport protein